MELDSSSYHEVAKKTKENTTYIKETRVFYVRLWVVQDSGI